MHPSPLTSSSWVATKDSAVPEGGNEISIEKLESQLNTLKSMFAEKQKLVSDLEAYGPEGEQQSQYFKPLLQAPPPPPLPRPGRRLQLPRCPRPLPRSPPKLLPRLR